MYKRLPRMGKYGALNRGCELVNTFMEYLNEVPLVAVYCGIVYGVL